MSERPWVKVYREIIDDTRFETIYPNDRNLATWLRMLIMADAMYPAPAPLAGFSRAAVQALTDPACGLVEIVGDRHFRLHGLKTERSQQSDAGKIGAAARWGRIAPASDPGMGCDAYQLSPAQTIPTELSPAPTGPDIWYAVTAKYPDRRTHPAQWEWITRLATDFGVEAFEAALRAEITAGPRNTMLSRTEARLLRKNDEPKPPKPPQPLPAWKQDFKVLLEQREATLEANP